MKQIEANKPRYVAASLQEPQQGRCMDLSRIMFNPCISRFVVQKWHTTQVTFVTKVEDNFFIVETTSSVYYLTAKREFGTCFGASSYRMPKPGQELNLMPFLHNNYSNAFMLYLPKKVFVKDCCKFDESIYFIKSDDEKTYLVRTL